MRSSERHQLKENQFATATQETLSWASDNRNTLLYTGGAVVVLLLVLIGGFYYQQDREQKASAMLGEGLKLYSSQIVAPGTAVPPGITTFNNATDRAKAASNKFLETADHYAHTDSATMANYFLGLCAQDMGDNTKAEEYLKKVSDSGNKDIAGLAKTALANFYHNTGRDPQAIQAFKELIEKPTNTTPKVQSQLSLADIYATTDPTQARRLYEEIAKDNADTPVANLVNSRIAALK